MKMSGNVWAGVVMADGFAVDSGVIHEGECSGVREAKNCWRAKARHSGVAAPLTAGHVVHALDCSMR